MSKVRKNLDSFLYHIFTLQDPWAPFFFFNLLSHQNFRTNSILNWSYMQSLYGKTKNCLKGFNRPRNETQEVQSRSSLISLMGLFPPACHSWLRCKIKCLSQVYDECQKNSVHIVKVRNAFSYKCQKLKQIEVDLPLASRRLGYAVEAGTSAFCVFLLHDPST